MQRRAAAVYLVLFLVIGAGAYAYTGIAEKPQVELDAESYAPGDELTVDDRTYTVNAIGETSGSDGTTVVGNLTWTDPDATYTASLENNTTVSWQQVSWEGQPVENYVLEDGQTLQYNGSSHEVALNESAGTLVIQRVSNVSINDTFERGGSITLRLDGQLVLGATISEITDSEATLSIADDYLVAIQNVSDPDSVSLVEHINVSRELRSDPSVFNTTTTIEGVEYVTNRSTNQNRPLSEYLEEPTVQMYDEGDTLAYDGNDTLVGNITRTTVPLSWNGTRVNLVDLAEGDTPTLNGQEYLVHFPDNSTVQLAQNTTSNWDTYQEDLQTISVYNERMAGLWGVTILAILAAMILAIGAYIPVKD